MTTEEKDNSWKYFSLFMLAYFTFLGLILPLLDEYLFNFAWKRFLCDNNFIFKTNSTKEWCMIK